MFLSKYPPLLLLLGMLVVVAALFPLLAGVIPADQHEFYMQQIVTVMVLGLFCMSLDLLVGIAGLVSLGHAAFYGLGAYLLVLLTPEYEAPQILTVVPLALLAVGGIAALVGAVALRTSGIYFIMVTLAIGQMGFYLFNDARFAGGSDGLYLFVKPNLTVGGVTLVDFESLNQFYYATLVLLIAAFALMRRLLESPFGKVVRGIGVNENRTGGLGYNVYVYKLVLFVIAAMVAALAGMLAATQYGFVSPGMLGWHMSGTALVTVILGGMGTLFGPVVGAAVIEILRYGLEHLTEHWLLVYGLLIIALVLVLPRGLAGIGMGPGGRPSWLPGKRAGASSPAAASPKTESPEAAA